MLASATALDQIARSDWVHIYLTQRARHMPDALAREIQLEISAICLKAYRLVSAMGMVSAAVIGLVFLPIGQPTVRWWVAGQLIASLLMMLSMRRLLAAQRDDALAARTVNRWLFAPTLFSGAVWGMLPCVVGTASPSAFYISILVVLVVCAGGFFMSLGHWPLSLTFATSLLTVTNVCNYVIGADGWATLAALGPPFFGGLFGVSLVVCHDLVESRGRSAVARERQQLIDLLLGDYERGEHEFLWETDVDFKLVHVPPRMIAAAHGDPNVAAGGDLREIIRLDGAAANAIEQRDTFRARVFTSGPGGDGELRLWGRPKVIGGECVGYSGVGSDEIAARRTAIAELTRQRLDAIVSVTSGLAHDFNNQLATILGAVELASLDPTLSDGGRTHLSRAIDAVLRSRRLTGDLVIAAGHDATYQPSTFGVAEAIGCVINDIKTVYPTIDFEVRCESPLTAFVDRSHFERALRNLLENSCQALTDGVPVDRDPSRAEPMPPDGRGRTDAALNSTGTTSYTSTANGGESVGAGRQSPLVEIEASSGTGPDGLQAVEIQVSDNGPGIPAQLSDVMFEPYVSKRMERGGTGLGLAIAKGFAHQAGGALDLVPTSVGARFRMVIPRSGDDHAPFGEEPALGNQEAASNARLHGTFVVVEDDHEFAIGLCNSITSLGGSVELMRSVAEAQQRFADDVDDIDCVICDLVLPDGEGYDVIASLRERRRHVRAIYISGFTHTHPASVHPDLQCPFLAKPFSNAELLRTLSRVGVDIGDESNLTPSAPSSAEL